MLLHAKELVDIKSTNLVFPCSGDKDHASFVSVIFLASHVIDIKLSIFFQPIVLEGHHKAVTAQALSHRERPTLLCSCSDDYIIVWNINKARSAIENGDFIILQFIYNFLVLKRLEYN